MQGSSRGSLPPLAWLLIGLPVVVLLALSLPTLRNAAVSGRDWTGELATLSESQAVAQLEQWSRRADPAERPPACLLNAPRTAVAEATRQALSDSLDQWRMLPEDEATRRIGDLARDLAEAAPRFQPPGRRRAAELAVQLLCWPVSGRDEQTRQLIDDCQRVLAAGEAADDVSDVSPPSPLQASGTEGPTRLGGSSETPPHSLQGLPAEVLRWPSLSVRTVRVVERIGPTAASLPGHSRDTADAAVATERWAGEGADSRGEMANSARGEEAAEKASVGFVAPDAVAEADADGEDDPGSEDDPLSTDRPTAAFERPRRLPLRR